MGKTNTAIEVFCMIFLVLIMVISINGERYCEVKDSSGIVHTGKCFEVIKYED